MSRSSVFLLMTAVAAVAQTPAPQLSISGNGSQSLDLMRGWPLIVRVSVLHSQRFQLTPKPDDLTIAPAASAWYDALSFKVAGVDAGWPLALAQRPDNPALALPSRSVFQALWQMSGDDTAALKAGTYRITAHLEVADGDGWKGAVDSAPIVVNVIDEPDSLSPDQRSYKALLQARYAINQGDFGAASLIADALLAGQPGDPSLLELRALLYEQAGDLLNAAAAATAAVHAYESLPAPAQADGRTIQEPPDFLILLKSRLWAAYVASLNKN